MKTMFNFENLSPQDFEELCSDIICKHLNLDFERFKPGKDKGIDLRLLENNAINTIVQIKHQPGSYTSNHKSTLTKEFKSFKKHNHSFEKYILITSAELSGVNKDEILKLSDGAIKSADDIWGIEFIEDFLRRNPEIVRQHYKLWLSSVEIINSVLHQKVYGKSEGYLSELLKRKNWFVQTWSLHEGIKILKQRKVLLILGDPGVGKTFHAELICLALIAEKYEFIYAESIDEAEDVFIKDKKQVFFIDDFMGANFLDLFKENTENKIIRFIDRIKSTENKYVVFCSRTTIFNSAIQRSIHLGNKQLENKGLLLEVTKYSDMEKAKILYNHLVYRGLDRKYFETVRNSKFYLKIVRHKNFNPRLIEFITSLELIEDKQSEEYLLLIENYLENPGEIWNSAYENQLSDESRWLLQTLFTLQGNCEENLLQECFNARLRYEIKNSNHVPSTSPYENSIKILLNGYLTREISNDWRYDRLKTEVSFRNPSVSDFLSKYLLENQYPLKNTISSVIYFFQIKYLIISKLILKSEISHMVLSIFHGKKNMVPGTKSTLEEELLSLIVMSEFDAEFEVTLKIFASIISKKKKIDFKLLNATFKYLVNYINNDNSKELGLDFKNIFYVLLLNIPNFQTIHPLIKKAESFDIDLTKEFLNQPTEEIDLACYKACEAEADSMLSEDDDYQNSFSPDDIATAVASVEERFYDKLSVVKFLSDSEFDAFNIDYEEVAMERKDSRYEDEYHPDPEELMEVSDEQISHVFRD